MSAYRQIGKLAHRQISSSANYLISSRSDSAPHRYTSSFACIPSYIFALRQYHPRVGQEQERGLLAAEGVLGASHST